MAHLLLLQPDGRAAARLSSALAGAHEVEVCTTWQAVHQRLGEGDVDGCVVDVDHPSRARSLEEIRRLRLRHDGIAIVAHGDFSNPAVDVFRLGELGVDGVLSPDEILAPADVRSTVDQALDSMRADAVRRTLTPVLGIDLARTVAWAMRHARAYPTVVDLAAALGHTPRGLAQKLRDGGLPVPRRLLLWGRLLLGGAYLGRDGRTTEEAAFALGYSTGTAFSRAMKRETGLTPAEIARRGGLDAVLAALFPAAPPRPRGRGGGAAGLILLLGALQAGCATVGGGGPSVDRDAIDAVLAAPPVDQVTFGVLAVDAASGRTLYARNAHRKFIPASNQKILVTATAMSLLGPDHAWETSLWAVGARSGETLEGDLVLVGTGDPTLSDRYWHSGEAALDALADSLWAAGIRRVAGRLVVDVAAWDSTTIADTWEVADLPWRYASTGGGFVIDEGELEVVVRGVGRPGAPAIARWRPRGRAAFVQPTLVTAEEGERTRVRAAYLPESRRVRLTGVVAREGVDTLAFAQRDPVRVAAAALEDALAGRGISIDAGTVVAWADDAPMAGGCVAGAVPDCAAATRLAGLRSPPLAEVVAGILEPSQNWMTEQLVRTLGAERGDAGSWEEGLRVVRSFLVDSLGVDSLDVAPRDGSGLSAYNLVTPRAIVRVLGAMAGGPHAEAFRDAMAEPGEEDSTLERRLPGLEGRLWAKTGTISNVNSLSGYLVTDRGRRVHFSVLSNGSGLPASTVRRAIDDVIRILAGNDDE